MAAENTNSSFIQNIPVSNTGPSSGDVLEFDGTEYTPVTNAGATGVTSSAIIANDSVVRGDGGVRGVQDSVVTISDTGLISGVLDPVSAQDAATKNYVDTNPTVPGGSNTEVQFNNLGSFGGITGVTTSGNDLKFADATSLVLGDDDGLVVFRTGTTSRMTNNTGSFELITGGEFVIDNTNSTGKISNRLGTDTTATQFDIRNNSDVAFFSAFGDGSMTYTGTLNGVSLTSGGSTTLFLNEFGIYTAPPAPTIDTIYTADGTVVGGIRTYTGESNNTLKFTQFNTDAATFTSGTEKSIGSNALEYSAFDGDGSGNKTNIAEIFIGSSVAAVPGIVIFNDVNSKGAIYAADYSAGFVNRSLVDKEYVDTHDAVPGGSNTQLQFNNNGVLDGTPFITTDGNNLNFADVTEARFGTSSDLKISHTGILSVIQNDTGNLEIINQGGASGDLILRNSSTSNDIIARLGTNTSTASFKVIDSALADIFIVRGDGNVGINTITPDSKLHVVDDGLDIQGLGDWTAQAASNQQWNGVAFGNNTFVAVNTSSGSQRAMTSTDNGVTWIDRPTPSLQFWVAIDFGNNTFVAVTGNAVMTSTDNGVTWIDRTPATSNGWNELTFALNLFVAVSSSGTGDRVMTSPDGITWTSQSSAADNAWFDITFGNSLFVAVSSDGTNQVMTSPDAITWTSQSASSINDWSAVGFGNGLFVAVAFNGSVMTSPDGVTWTDRTTVIGGGNNRVGVAFGNGFFVVNANVGGSMSSTDGINWISESKPSGLFGAVSFGNDIFVAVAHSGATQVMTLTSTIIVSTALKIDSITSGFLPPRLTTTERDLIQTPETGLEIYNTTTNEPEFFNGSIWIGTSDIPGGSNTELQFNNNGVFGGTTGITFSGGNLNFTSGNAANFGNSQELQIEFDGTNSSIQNFSGQMQFVQNDFNDDMSFINLGGTNSTIFSTGTGTSATSFKFIDNINTSLVEILGNGNVGINTTTPDSKLTIVEDAPTLLGDWILQTTAAADAWIQIAFGAGVFVATANGGVGTRIMSSPDGITWTARTQPVAREWGTLVFANSQFVSVASGADAMTSPDGITWTLQTTTGISNPAGLSFGAGLYVAVGLAGQVISSPDAITWTARTAAEANAWNAVTFGNSTFVAVSTAGTNRVMTSSDGITWASQSAATANDWRAVTFGNGLFVAVSRTGAGDRVMTSPDGITWTSRVSAADSDWRDIAFGNGFFVVTASGGTNSMTSTDGINWSLKTTASGAQFRSVTFGNNKFVTVGRQTTAGMTLPFVGTSTAILDLQSTTSGFLPPRVSTAQRDVIPTPVSGLSVFSTDSTHLEIHDGTAFRKQSKVAVNEFEIFQESDFPNAPSGGILTLNSGQYIIKDGYTTANRYFIADGATVIIRVETVNPIVYVGTGTFFSGTSVTRLSIFGGLFVFGAPGAQMFDMAGESFESISIFTFLEAQVISLAPNVTIGSFTNLRVLLFTNVFFDGVQEGVTFVDSIPVFENVLINTNALGTLPIFDISGTTSRATFKVVTVNPALTQPIFDIDPNIAGEPVIVEVNIEDNEIFYATGVTGTFTAVTDISFAAESITSVTDSSGVARFNYDGTPLVFVGQQLDLSTFLESTYNVTGIVTAFGGGFFEIASIAFAGNDTGVFGSDTVTIASILHGLNEFQTVLIDTDLSTDYDGGAEIYDVQADSFRINRTFTTTHSGTWDTGSLTEKDPNVTARFNTFQKDSKFIGCAFVNDNSIAVGTIVNNTFRTLTFGTTGSGLIECSNSERWKLIDEIEGIFEYTGNEPFDGFISYDFTVVSSGGAVEFRFKWQKDTGSGFVDLTDDVESLVDVGSTATSMTKTQPLTANTGDQIKPLITRNTGSSGITIRYATINVTQ